LRQSVIRPARKKELADTSDEQVSHRIDALFAPDAAAAAFAGGP
jgi:hypothetical protein